FKYAKEGMSYNDKIESLSYYEQGYDEGVYLREHYGKDGRSYEHAVNWKYERDRQSNEQIDKTWEILGKQRYY
ncbi:MAG: hypothetical protein ACRCXT_11845, partial [Paraclostridium sp.]